MVDSENFKTFLIAMLAMAVVGATSLEASNARADDPLDCGSGFHQFTRFTEQGHFNEFESCNFSEFNEGGGGDPVATDIDIPDIDIPDFGGPGDPIDPEPFF